MLRRAHDVLTDRFDKPAAIFRNPTIFEGASLSDLCSFVADNFFELCRGYC